MSDSIERINADITIVGAGIAGCIAALALKDYAKVVLIDKVDTPQYRIGECLAPAAKRILKKLEIYEALELSNNQDHLINIGAKSYWGSSKAHFVDHIRNPDGYGWYLDRKLFETKLRECVIDRKVTCIWPAQLKKVDHQEGKHILMAQADLKSEFSEQYRIESKFVIDASGRSAHYARSKQIKRVIYDKLVSCWAIFKDTNLNMSMIAAEEMGWWYASPLPKNQVLVVWHTDSDLMEGSYKKDKAVFFDRIQRNEPLSQIPGLKLSNMELGGIVSANSSRLVRSCGTDWASIGDASISFDPLSSQGMFNAMATGIQVAELIKHYDVIHAKESYMKDRFVHAYESQIMAIWNHYLGHKRTFYKQEYRWKNAAFWKRRQVD